MNTLTLDLGERSYPIHIGQGLLNQADLYLPHLAGNQVFIVTNQTVAPLYLATLKQTLRDTHIESLALPDGESYKTLASLNLIFDHALAQRLARDSTFIALGGGVVGDITGFAAACYQRGVNYIQVPTTLLAQVDSSVGGKTAVNHSLGKNMIGSFHQPRCVIIDTQTLETLPTREYIAGIAEIIKYGLLQDGGLFTWLEANMAALLKRDPQALSHAIENSCRIKAEVVAADEKETGRRALLNLGHTFAHAIETGLGYGRWLHGEAVAAGCCMAADLSMRLGWLGQADHVRICRLVEAAGLPAAAPADLPVAKMRDLMQLDKKVRGGRMPLVLLKSIGNAVVSFDFDEAALNNTLTLCRQSGS